MSRTPRRRTDTGFADTGFIDTGFIDTGFIDTVFVVYDGIQALDLTGPWEVFHGANSVLDDSAGHGAHRARYRLTLCSTDGRTITWPPSAPLAADPASNIEWPSGFLALLDVDGGAYWSRAGVFSGLTFSDDDVVTCVGTAGAMPLSPA